MAPRDRILDPVVALTFLAAHTRRLLLGTGIIILPQRNPWCLPRSWPASMCFSGGRLLFGIGVGYLEPEFRAIGAPYEARGAVTDEYLEAMQAIWSQEQPAYAGRHAAFSRVQAHPQPVQRPWPRSHRGRALPRRLPPGGLAARMAGTASASIPPARPRPWRACARRRSSARGRPIFPRSRSASRPAAGGSSARRRRSSPRSASTAWSCARRGSGCGGASRPSSAAAATSSSARCDVAARPIASAPLAGSPMR
jgi:alkanesulfonate monooxygenase SsuD/methylene tetrahydromethanopterin reductase-like flavin-dependent oxidoreductase (luciferase family)